MPLKQIFATYDRRENSEHAYFKFCPLCTTALQMTQVANLMKPVCPACGYVQFKNPSPAVGILVVDGKRVLLGKRGEAPEVGKWAIPSGYIAYANAELDGLPIDPRFTGPDRYASPGST